MKASKQQFQDYPRRCQFATVIPGGRRCVRSVHATGAHMLPSEPSPDDPDDPNGALERILQLAKEHGEESDPEHEVGDLQQSLMRAWCFLNAAQKRGILLEAEGDAEGRF